MLKSDLEQQLNDLTTFMSTSVYAAILRGLVVEQAGLEAGILQVAPVSQSDIALLNQNFGRRESVIAQQTYFESLRDRLKTEISRMEESGNEVTQEETEVT